MVKKNMDESLEALEKSLTKSHPILSRIVLWMNSKLDATKQKMISKSLWISPAEATKACLEHDLHQSAHFLEKDLIFKKNVSSCFQSYNG
jgi:hypothetical protein